MEISILMITSFYQGNLEEILNNLKLAEKNRTFLFTFILFQLIFNLTYAMEFFSQIGPQLSLIIH